MCILIDSSCSFDAINLGYSIVYFVLQGFCIFCLNVVDPDEMPGYALVFTVCKSTHVGGSTIQIDAIFNKSL